MADREDGLRRRGPGRGRGRVEDGTATEMDVKVAVLWLVAWHAAFSGRLPASRLSPPPQGRDLVRGTLTKSWNYKCWTVVLRLLYAAVADQSDVDGAIDEVRDFLRHQRHLGHMRGELGTPSHAKQWYAPMAALIHFTSRQRGDRRYAELHADTVDWWAVEFGLVREFRTPLGVVMPGSRDTDLDPENGRNPYRDRLAEFAVSGYLADLPTSRGKGSELLWDLLRDSDIASALPAHPIKLAFPITKVELPDGGFVAWLPEGARRGLSGPQPPQMVARYDAATGVDSYSSEPLADADVPVGKTKVIG